MIHLILTIILILFTTNKITTINTSFSARHIKDDLKLLYEKTIPTEEYKNLNINSFAGDIEVSSWAQNEVSVNIYGNNEAESKLVFDASGTDDGVKVDCGLKKKDEMDNLSLKIIVIVPASYNADLFTGGGSIKLSDLTGTIKMNTSGGSIIISNTNGKVTAFTSGGNISDENSSGELEFSTSGGHISALNYTGNISASTMGGHIILSGSDGSIKAATSGGNIKIDYTGKNDGIDASTLGGNIVATLPADFDANADIGTLAGNLHCDFIKTENNKPVTFLKTKFNNGGKILKCITSGGNITINKK